MMGKFVYLLDTDKPRINEKIISYFFVWPQTLQLMSFFV